MPSTPPLPTPLDLSAASDRAMIRAAGGSTRYALVSFTAPRAPRRAERIPVNLAIVLDRSGSMKGEKFRLARQAVEEALGRLHPDDRFSLVVFDDEVDVIAESTSATGAATRDALDRLRRVEPRGTTDLGGGWLRGCEQVARSVRNGAAVNRCLLLTDGLANSGITDRGELTRHAAALRERGVQTSTFGVGEDFDERLLACMSDSGGGHFYFLSNPAQIPELIESEVGEALEVVLRQAALEVRLVPGMEARSLTRFRTRRAVGDDENPALLVEVGDLVSGQQVDVVVSLRFPRGKPGAGLETEFGLVDAEGLPFAPAASLRWTYGTHAQNDAQPRNRVVDRRVAALYAARARSEAVDHNRAGYFDRARNVLTSTAERIRGYAVDDAELTRLVDALLREAEEFAAGALTPMSIKQAHFAARNASSARDVLGRAHRRSD